MHILAFTLVLHQWFYKWWEEQTIRNDGKMVSKSWCTTQNMLAIEFICQMLNFKIQDKNPLHVHVLMFNSSKDLKAQKLSLMKLEVYTN
jgi:hypothetical protein